MGLIDTTCDPSGDGGCGALFAQGQAILDSAWRGIEANDNGDCGDVDRYVTLGQAVAPLVQANDHLVVTMLSHGPVPQAVAQGYSGAPELLFETQWRVELWCHGWPTLSGHAEPVMPDPVLLHALSAQMYGFGATMYGQMLTDRNSGLLFGDCTTSVITALNPLGPSGGMAGWGVGIAVRT